MNAEETLMEAVLRVIQADPHQWSRRPCQSCRAVSAIVGKPFGCYEYQRIKATEGSTR